MYINHCAQVGYGKTRRDVLTIVETAAGRKGEPPRARLLTSATAFEMLKEKERKKQTEAGMKEKKRKEEEEMKKRKEEEQRKKAEERARKQEQRAKEKAEKEAQRAKKEQRRKPRKKHRGPRKQRGSNLQLLEQREVPTLEVLDPQNVHEWKVPRVNRSMTTNVVCALFCTKMINLGRIEWPAHVEGGFVRIMQMTV
jgi:hypothetical protein